MHDGMSGDQDTGCHCYVLGTLESKSGIAEAQTELKKKVLHTLWEEVLQFPLTKEEMLGGTLTLTLRNCDKFSRHSIVGELKLNLAEMEESFGKAQWERLKSPEKVWTSSVSSSETLMIKSLDKRNPFPRELHVGGWLYLFEAGLEG